MQYEWETTNLQLPFVIRRSVRVCPEHAGITPLAQRYAFVHEENARLNDARVLISETTAVRRLMALTLFDAATLSGEGMQVLELCKREEISHYLIGQIAFSFDGPRNLRLVFPQLTPTLRTSIRAALLTKFGDRVVLDDA